MKNNTLRIAPLYQRRKAIFKSWHDPFLRGNIARRDVIKIISRKAISSLANTMFFVWISSSAFNLKTGSGTHRLIIHNVFFDNQ